jgi:hypothetical protein
MTSTICTKTTAPKANQLLKRMDKIYSSLSFSHSLRSNGPRLSSLFPSRAAAPTPRAALPRRLLSRHSLSLPRRLLSHTRIAACIPDPSPSPHPPPKHTGCRLLTTMTALTAATRPAMVLGVHRLTTAPDCGARVYPRTRSSRRPRSRPWCSIHRRGPSAPPPLRPSLGAPLKGLDG